LLIRSSLQQGNPSNTQRRKPSLPLLAVGRFELVNQCFIAQAVHLFILRGADYTYLALFVNLYLRNFRDRRYNTPFSLFRDDIRHIEYVILEITIAYSVFFQ
jgi:hypothetical protein